MWLWNLYKTYAITETQIGQAHITVHKVEQNETKHRNPYKDEYEMTINIQGSITYSRIYTEEIHTQKQHTYNSKQITDEQNDNEDNEDLCALEYDINGIDGNIYGEDALMPYTSDSEDEYHEIQRTPDTLIGNTNPETENITEHWSETNSDTDSESIEGNTSSGETNTINTESKTSAEDTESDNIEEINNKQNINNEVNTEQNESIGCYMCGPVWDKHDMADSKPSTSCNETNVKIKIESDIAAISKGGKEYCLIHEDANTTQQTSRQRPTTGDDDKQEQGENKRAKTQETNEKGTKASDKTKTNEENNKTQDEPKDTKTTRAKQDYIREMDLM